MLCGLKTSTAGLGRPFKVNRPFGDEMLSICFAIIYLYLRIDMYIPAEYSTESFCCDDVLWARPVTF